MVGETGMVPWYAFLVCLLGTLPSSVPVQSVNVPGNAEVGPVLVRSSDILVATSKGLLLYPKTLSSPTTFLPDTEILVLNDLQGGTVLVCNRDANEARCRIYSSFAPSSVIATSASLYTTANPATFFARQLSYTTMSRSTVVDLTDASPPYVIVAIPATADSSRSVRTMIRFTSGAGMMPTGPGLLLQNIAREQDAFNFALSQRFRSAQTDLFARVVFSRRNVSLGTTLYPQATFLGQVCSQEDGVRAGEYLDAYGTYSEISLSNFGINATTTGLFGSVVVDGYETGANTLLLAWSATSTIPSYVSELSTADSVVDFGLKCRVRRDPNYQISRFLNVTNPPVCGTSHASAFLLSGSSGSCSGSFQENVMRYPLTSTIPFTAGKRLLTLAAVRNRSLALEYGFASVTIGAIGSTSVIFVGTKNGALLKASRVSTGTDGYTIYEARQIDPMRRPIDRVRFNGLDFVATVLGGGAGVAGQVLKLDPVDCGVFTSCRRCINQHEFNPMVTATAHPFCGWCSFSGMCMTQADCNSASRPDGQSAIFVKQDTKCPMAVSSTPGVAPVAQSRNVTITVANLPLSGKIRCRFPGFNQVFTPGEVLSATTARCATPTGTTGMMSRVDTNVEIFSVTYGLSLFTSDNAVLGLFDCDFFTRCEVCTDPSFQCSWCSYDNMCRKPNGTCQIGGKVSQCPVFTTIDPRGASLDLVTAINISTTGLPALRAGWQDSFSCALEALDGTMRLNLTATVVGNELRCEPFTLDRSYITSANGSMPFNLRLFFNDYEMRNGSSVLQVVGYECAKTGAAGCSLCLGQPVFSECRWCQMARTCTVSTCPMGGVSTNDCPAPNITNILPEQGPTKGGTRIQIKGVNFGFKVSDITSISFNTKECTDISDFSIIEGVRCLTPDIGVEQVTTYPVTIRTLVNGFANVGSGSKFTFFPVAVADVSPNHGPIAGGTVVTVRGLHMNIGILTVMVGSTAAPITHRNNSLVTVAIPAVNASGPVDLVVAIDGFSITEAFDYRANPTVQDSTRTTSITAGGLPMVFGGTNFNSVNFVTATFRFGGSSSMTQDTQCTVLSDTAISCPTAVIPTVGSNATVSLTLDGRPFTTANRITYEAAPTFFVTDHSVFTNVEQVITINGTNLLNGGLSDNEYDIRIGTGSCSVNSLSDTNVQCRPPRTPEGNAINGTLPIFIRLGNFYMKVGTATYETIGSSSSTNVALIAGPVGGVFGLLIIALIIVFFVMRRNSATHSSQMRQVLLQMDAIEANVASECKSAFADLQTNLGDLGITAESSFEALPFWTFDEYAVKLLFPHNNLMPMHMRVQLQDDDFNSLRDVLSRFERRLLTDKKFLLPFIETLEQQKKFAMVDRVYVASLLMVAFQDNLYYATEILKLLLAKVIRNGSGRNPKLLLRRTESVAEKMLTNWLAYCLHDYIKSEVGTPLFMLFHAMKTHIEKGPVDAVTGEARNCLSEERLLRDKVDCEELVCYAVASPHKQDQKYTVRLLSCDTISQAKEKVLDAIYRTSPVSHRPPFEKIDLSLLSATGSSTIPLQDLDQTSVTIGDMRQLNTVGYYKVNAGTTFCITDRGAATLTRVKDHVNVLFPKHSSGAAGPGLQRTFSEDSKVWHLTKPQDSDAYSSNVGGRGGGKLVSEIYLTRLLSAKKTLQEYVDQLFRVVFCSEDGRIPAAIKYLFDFIDSQAEEMGITDPDVVQTWKNNSIPLRFWINVIKNPEFVLDINKTATVDNCLSVVAQAFMDSCSLTDIRLTKDSPSTKLLYAKEVKENYRSKILSYYSEIKTMRPIPEQEMQEMMMKASQQHMRSDILSKESAVFELFVYASKYAEPISDTLEEDNRTGLVKVFESLLSEAPDLATAQAGHVQNGQMHHAHVV